MHSLLYTEMFELHSYMFRAIDRVILRESHNLTNHRDTPVVSTFYQLNWCTLYNWIQILDSYFWIVSLCTVRGLARPRTVHDISQTEDETLGHIHT
jgi:hypothetical protein